MPPNPIDFEKLLHFFERLYAHALTLQDMFENYDHITDETYPEVHPKYVKLASQQFDMFYRALNDPEGFAKAVRGFLDTQTKGPVQ